MEKINFINGQAPALSAEILNQLQDNIDNGKLDISKTVNINLDTFKDDGFFYADSGCTNKPTSANGYLHIHKLSGNYVLQEFTYAFDPTYKWSRVCYNGEWYPWKLFMATIEINYGNEFKTGRIINGKEEYGKIIDCGKMPDTSSKTIQTGLQTSYTVTDFWGVVHGGSYRYKMVQNKVSNYSVTLGIGSNNVVIETFLSNYKDAGGIVEIHYLK